MSQILVKKFGGAGLSSIEKVREAAELLRADQQKGHQVIAVVSAMGKTTDELIAKAYQISSRPDRRELDMLISTGERVSMSLLTMALKDMGCNAISFTGSQAGVLTDDSHGLASITEVKPIRVEESLSQNKIVVVAGFQGVNPVTKEITTLGRGGTDTTAVAFAAHFGADRCEIIKEVDGIFTADPNKIDTAELIEKVNYDSLLHMCQWGAKALHFRSVEMAKRLNTKIWVGSMKSPEKGTLCSSEGNGHGMNILENLFSLEAEDSKSTVTSLIEVFNENGWQQPLVISANEQIWLQGSDKVYECCKDIFEKVGARKLSEYGYQCVTFTGVDELNENISEDSRETSEAGIHLFFKNPLSQTSLNSFYTKVFS